MAGLHHHCQSGDVPIWTMGASLGAYHAANTLFKHPDVVKHLFEIGKADAGGSFPDYLLQQAESAVDAPGCSPFAAELDPHACG